MFEEINSLLYNYLNGIIADKDVQLAKQDKTITDQDMELDMAYNKIEDLEVKIQDLEVKIQDLEEKCNMYIEGNFNDLEKGSKRRRNPSRTCARKRKMPKST
jgi:peptidoglycan hydrolase CwlO-like protein